MYLKLEANQWDRQIRSRTSTLDVFKSGMLIYYAGKMFSRTSTLDVFKIDLTMFDEIARIVEPQH